MDDDAHLLVGLLGIVAMAIDYSDDLKQASRLISRTLRVSFLSTVIPFCVRGLLSIVKQSHFFVLARSSCTGSHRLGVRT